MMANDENANRPGHYRDAIRVFLRFSAVMLVVGLLSGIAYQESGKKVSWNPGPEGPAYWDATLRLALVHGHLIMSGVLLPVAMACMLYLARWCGGREIGRRALAWALYTYLPFVSVSMGLMLFKAYHVLLSVRGGQTDMSLINAAYFGGSKAVRHSVYGFVHVGMAFGLCLFAWCVWRSLGAKQRN